MSAILGRCIWFLVSFVGWSYYLTPEPLKRLLAFALGGIVDALGYRRKVIEANFDRAFPGELRAQRRARRRAFCRHLARVVFEITMLAGPMARFVRKHVVVEGKTHFDRALASGQGVIFVASHIGNWEVMAGIAIIHLGQETVFVTKRLKPDWLHEAFKRARARLGVIGTFEPKTFRDALRAIKSNVPVGFVMDQYLGPPVGTRVPLFGTPVGTSTAVAMLATRTGAQALTVVNYRKPDGSFVVRIEAPIAWQAEGSVQLQVAKMTAEYSSRIESHVREHPEQWLWTHRRFKGDLGPLRADEWESGRTRQ